MESRDFDDSDDNGEFGEPQEPELSALASNLHPKFYYEQFARTYLLGMCAVLKSNIDVTSLRIETNIDEVSLAPQVLEAPFKSFSSEPLAVSLEVLEIYTSIGGAVLVNSETPTLSGLAGHLCNLKYLCVHMNYLEVNLSPSNPCPEFLGLLHSPRLESLIFSHFKATASFLLSFFQKHLQLAYIELSDIKLVDGDWKEAFSLLQSDMPRLKELRVGGLVGQDDKYLRIRPVQKTDELFKSHRHWDRDLLDQSFINRCCTLGSADLQKGLEFS
ncbi:uncharacterized protein LDX57_002670 [Aspergillus melleus]|uniref:uncharacterized protein n=1 Tax=Aspergillus melleus TaxID=138277 RepID=UPI001E8E03E8|nr:uncharacterized protein LDX57_002670 [Aspergillus melleus]KAH8424924.1 hypothetical protein LDX57_002670 [Aspergillus melleus]